MTTTKTKDVPTANGDAGVISQDFNRFVPKTLKRANVNQREKLKKN